MTVIFLTENEQIGISTTAGNRGTMLEKSDIRGCRMGNKINQRSHLPSSRLPSASRTPWHLPISPEPKSSFSQTSQKEGYPTRSESQIFVVTEISSVGLLFPCTSHNADISQSSLCSFFFSLLTVSHLIHSHDSVNLVSLRILTGNNSTLKLGQVIKGLSKKKLFT